MVNAKKILVVVPARGGSKGVKLKNLHPLWGRPLIAHVGDIVRALPEIDRAVVSTDHEEIAVVAESCGLSAPFRRPESLSGDRIGDAPVLVHALETMDRIDGVSYDVVIMLQPTCPQRKPEHVRACIEKMVSENLDSVWTVSPSDLKYHPLKALCVSGDGGLSYFDPRGAGVIARQQLEQLYYRNGAAYAISRATLLEKNSIIGEKNGAVVVREKLISIDTIDDFETIEKLAVEK